MISSASGRCKNTGLSSIATGWQYLNMADGTFGNGTSVHAANATTCLRTKRRRLFDECDDRDLTVFLNLVVCVAVTASLVALIIVSIRLWRSCRDEYETHTCLAEAEMEELNDDPTCVSM